MGGCGEMIVGFGGVGVHTSCASRDSDTMMGCRGIVISFCTLLEFKVSVWVYDTSPNPNRHIPPPLLYSTHHFNKTYRFLSYQRGGRRGGGHQVTRLDTSLNKVNGH